MNNTQSTQNQPMTSLLTMVVMITAHVRKTRILATIILALLISPLSVKASAKEIIERGNSLGEAYIVEKIGEGFGLIWGLAWVDDHILITQRTGEIVRFDPNTGEKKTLFSPPAVFVSGQGGLLDIKKSPQFEQDRTLFVTYSREVDGQGSTTLARFTYPKNHQKITDQKQLAASWTDVFVSRSRSKTGRHYGSRIAFDNAGYLYFTVGDRGERPNGQDLSTHAGSVLRLRQDGTAPENNPFSDTPNALPEIWSYGHRNPQGLAFSNDHKTLWLIEHGPRGGDEINRVVGGDNYGWATVSHGKEYWGPLAVGEATQKPGMTNPVKVYTPSIAPGSLLVYSGKLFRQWQDYLFSGALKLRYLNVIAVEQDRLGEEVRLLEALDRRIRALVEDPEGRIYFSTDRGQLYRLTK